jgi:competence protein ComEC
LQLRGRLIASLSLIALFAVMTRAEPSVLRASAMASIACWSAFTGQPVARLRTIGVAVAALLLVDPMLARSVGFQLSVGASLGLVTLAAPIAARLRGPRWLAEPLAVTLAAQVGVAPILLTTFGGMPVVTPLANLLAVPVAGPLTAWGLGAGLLAGIVGAPFAALLHVPTNAMVWWIAGVAHASARVPLGTVDVRAVLIGVVVAAVVVWWRRAAIPVAAVALVLVALPPRGALHDVEVARGVHLWRAGGVVLVVDGSASAAPVLDGLRRAGVGTVDLLVARKGSKDVAGLVADIRSRHRVRSVAAPSGHRIRDATAVTGDLTVHIGRLVVRLTPHDGALDVHL